MSLVPSLLQAIVRVDGEALVMHAGDKPYVVAPTGQVELANRGLTLEAVNGVVNQLLPVELQQALEEFGAVQYELPPMPEFPGEHFTVVAARGGDDLWTEIRRRRVPDDDRVPEEFFDSSALVPVEAQGHVAQPVISEPAAPSPSTVALISQAAASPVPPVWHATPLPPAAGPPMPAGSLDDGAVDLLDDDLGLPNAAQLWPARSDDDSGEEIELDLDADIEAEEEEVEEAPPVLIAERETHTVDAPAPVASRAIAPPPPIAVEIRETPAAAAPPPVAPPAVAPPPPIAVEIRETPAAAAPTAMATAEPQHDDPTSDVAAAPVVTDQPAAPMQRIFRAMQRYSLTASDLPLDESTPAVAAEAPVPVSEPLPAAASAAPVLEVTTPEVVAAAPPVVTEPVPAPVAKVHPTPPVVTPAASIPAASPLDVATPDVAAAAPPVVTEQVPVPVAEVHPILPVPTPAARIPGALRLDAPKHKVVAPAPPVVNEPVPVIKVRPTPPAAAPPARMTGALRLDASKPEVVAAAPPAVTVQPPVTRIAGGLRLDSPVPEVAAAMPPVVPEQSPAVQAPTMSADPVQSTPAVPPPSLPLFVAPPLAAAPEEPLAPHRTAPVSQLGVVVPITRTTSRPEPRAPVGSDSTLSGLERLLRVSAARGASTLYLSSDSRPSVRVDGELQMLDGEPVHVSRDVEALLLTLMPERSHEALRSGGATEWIVDVEGVGRVRCMSFHDHLGPGGVFRLMPTRALSADQLGLPRQVQALAIEPEGLVLVAGSRSSGKRTLISAFVDLVNRTRRDHIITIEREINIVHERGQSFISQREVRGNDEQMLAAARGALREDPDVLVIEDLGTGPLINIALEAAASGRLVVGGFSAHTATGAIDRIIDFSAPEYRRQVQLALADSLRGVIVQTLLRKTGGGRTPAREVLLNTPAVSSVIAEGKTSQLSMAIEGGRRYGMMPLNDTLVGLVQNGSVEAREAYRLSPDRSGFLAALSHHGLDTSFVERPA